MGFRLDDRQEVFEWIMRLACLSFRSVGGASCSELVASGSILGRLRIDSEEAGRDSGGYLCGFVAVEVQKGSG